MAKNNRDELAAKRQARVAARGHDEGAEVPRRREMPIVPFFADGGLICEIKRRSPFGGDIAPGADAVALAGDFIAAGARDLSVVTDPDWFDGGLEDLMAIKRAHPETPVMRRDYLFDNDDLDVSWRAGADAVLLVAGILTEDRLHMLYRCAKGLGLEAVVEVNDADDIRKAARIRPGLLAVNSRDPASGVIDRLRPLRVRQAVDWPARFIFASGVADAGQAAYAGGAGFHGVQAGKALAADRGLIAALDAALRRARPARFWPEIARRLNAAARRPLVAVGGLVREEDALLAGDLGADILGFVFDPASPRAVDAELLRVLRDDPVLKVAVVAGAAGGEGLAPPLRHLLEDGLIDAVRFQGMPSGEDEGRWPVWYAAFCPASAADLAGAEAYRCPRLLLDAPGALPGESARRVMPDVLETWALPLWLAGGLTPDNLPRIVEARRPELVELAAGLDEAPGVKCHEKMRRLFKGLPEG